MKVCYINLDSASDRRALVEENFRANNALGWTLERVPAIESASLSAATYSGISANEAACFASHARTMANHGPADDDLMIVEDDVMFGPDSQRVIAGIVEKTPRDKWDLIFTDLVVPGIPLMLSLYEFRRAGKLRLLDLASLSSDARVVPVSGASAYVVNRNSLPRLAAELSAATTIAAPYDIHLWQLIAAKKLVAHAIFPFPTTISHLADASQINKSGAFATELLWNAFRRLVWLHGDPGEAERTLARIDPAYFDDKPAEFMGKIVTGLISKNFTPKWVFK